MRRHMSYKVLCHVLTFSPFFTLSFLCTFCWLALIWVSYCERGSVSRQMLKLVIYVGKSCIKSTTGYKFHQAENSHLLRTHGGQPWCRHRGCWGHADLSCHLVHVVHTACVGHHGYIDVHVVIVHAGVCLLPEVWWRLLWKHAAGWNTHQHVRIKMFILRALNIPEHLRGLVHVGTPSINGVWLSVHKACISFSACK